MSNEKAKGIIAELEAAKLWGFSADDLDEKAIFIDRFKFKRETIELPQIIKGSHSRCEIRLAQAPNGRWAVDFSLNLSTEGRGASPSIWNRTQYPDRQSALDAELDSVIKYCKKSEDKIAEEMLKMLAKFKADQNRIDHPDLF